MMLIYKQITFYGFKLLESRVSFLIRILVSDDSCVKIKINGNHNENNNLC